MSYPWAIACFAVASACGRVGFDSAGDYDGGPRIDGASLVDAGPAPKDASVPTAPLLETSCGTGGESVLILPDGTAFPSGSRLLVRVVVRDGVPTPPTATDSAGNSYSLVVQAEATGAGTLTHSYVLTSTLRFTLQAGDSITVSHANQLTTAVAVDALEIGPASTTITASEESTAPMASIGATAAGGTVLAVVGVSNHTTIEYPEGWTPLASLVPSCGGAPGNADGFAAYRSVLAPGPVSFEATIEHDRRWSLGLIYFDPP